MQVRGGPRATLSTFVGEVSCRINVTFGFLKVFAWYQYSKLCQYGVPTRKVHLIRLKEAIEKINIT
jgi:hypothetical protein